MVKSKNKKKAPAPRKPKAPAKPVKAAAKPKAAAKKPAKRAVKPVAKKAVTVPKKAASKKKEPLAGKTNGHSINQRTTVMVPKKVVVIKDPFLKRQQDRLLHLRDSMLDSMSGVARDTLRSRAEGSEASAFGMHQADAGSDAYDRDFALSLLSQEQDALNEIDEALKRIDLGSYGVCEMSGKQIPHARLEAIPFTRFTVDCQSQLEKQRKMTRSRQPVTSLFGLTEAEEAAGDGEEEETTTESKE